MSELQDRVMAFMWDQDPDGIGDNSMWEYIRYRIWFEDSLPHLLFALEVGVSFYDITNYLLMIFWLQQSIKEVARYENFFIQVSNNFGWGIFTI